MGQMGRFGCTVRLNGSGMSIGASNPPLMYCLTSLYVHNPP